MRRKKEVGDDDEEIVEAKMGARVNMQPAPAFSRDFGKKTYIRFPQVDAPPYLYGPNHCVSYRRDFHITTNPDVKD